jgi:hypothetical protein
MIGGNAQQFQERVDGIKRDPTQQHSSGDPNINRSGSPLKNMDLRQHWLGSAPFTPTISSLDTGNTQREGAAQGQNRLEIRKMIDSDT